MQRESQLRSVPSSAIESYMNPQYSTKGPCLQSKADVPSLSVAESSRVFPIVSAISLSRSSSAAHKFSTDSFPSLHHFPLDEPKVVTGVMRRNLRGHSGGNVRYTKSSCNYVFGR